MSCWHVSEIFRLREREREREREKVESDEMKHQNVLR
jgi:hypothetical protein